MNCLAIATIGLHLVSWHDTGGYNNVNPGVYTKTECGITIGAYENSINKTTVYVGYTYDPPKLPVWASVAIATGYKPETNMTLTPIGMVGLKSQQYKGTRFRIGYIPKIKGVNQVNVLHLTFEKSF